MRIAFLLAVAVAAGLLIHSQQAEIAAALARLQYGALGWAALAAALHVALSFLAWGVLLYGPELQLGWMERARLFFLSQVGKYLPGGIWQFVAAAELGRDSGLARKDTAASFLLAVILSISAGATLALLGLPTLNDMAPARPFLMIAIALPLVLLTFPAASRWLAQTIGMAWTPRPDRMALACCLGLAQWLVAGVMMLALVAGTGINIGWGDLPMLSAIYAAAWIAGFLVIFAPAGAGAREATLIALLATQLPLAEATIVAIAARIALTVVDLLGAGLALLVKAPPASQ